VRTIHLRHNGQGTWYVSVTQDNHPVISNTPYESTPQALRAFIHEGHHQPFARMLVHRDKNENAVVIRKARACVKDQGEHAIDMQSVKAVVAKV
jgi:hypothetical protein